MEKPFTVTGAEAEDLVALARERHLFAMEAMWTRFSPLVRAAAGLVQNGAIGRVTAVQADYASSPPYDPGSRLWNADLAGGALLDIGVYPISFGAMLLGEPDAVRAVATPAPNGVDANTAVIARYTGGAVGLYHFGLWADSPRVAMITGTGGIITVGPPFLPPGAPHPAARGPGAGDPCDHHAGARLHLRGRRGRPLPARRPQPNPRCSRWTTRWP